MVKVLIFFTLISMQLSFAEKKTLLKSGREDVYISFLVSSASISNNTLLSYFSSSNLELCIYNFTDDRITFINDGRIPFGIYTANTLNDRFILLDSRFTPQTNVIILNKNGTFEDYIRLSTIKNFPNNIKLGIGSAIQTGEFLVSFLTFNEPKRVFLARLSLKTNTFEVLQTYKKEENLDYFFSCIGGHYLKFEVQSGKITLLQKDSYLETRVIRPPDPLVAQDKDDPLGGYKGVVNGIQYTPVALNILWFSHSLNGNPLVKPDRKILSISSDLALTFHDNFQLHTFQGKNLSLNDRSGTLAISASKE